MTIVLVVAAGLAFVIWRIEAAIANAPEQEPELSWLDQADGVEHCTVATCPASPTLHVHAGRDYYPFCEEHGMPHLTKGLAK